MKIYVECFGATDVGQRRETNEDQYLIAELNGSMKIHHTSVPIDDCSTVFGCSQGHLFLVADGVGGHAAGERASALAISAVSAYALNGLQWLAHAENAEEDISDQLQQIAHECQKRLIQSARQHPNEQGMATTLTLAIVMWPNLYVMHIGDSRCYLIRDGELEQLTRDHTLGQLYADCSDDPATAERANHVLWNVVSTDGETTPVADVIQRKLTAGDQLLLCTDGLSDLVETSEFTHIMVGNTAQEACKRLVALANSRGGKDNITVVTSRFKSVAQETKEAAMVEIRVPLEEMIATSEEQADLADTDEFVVAELNHPAR